MRGKRNQIILLLEKIKHLLNLLTFMFGKCTNFYKPKEVLTPTNLKVEFRLYNPIPNSASVHICGYVNRIKTAACDG